MRKLIVFLLLAAVLFCLAVPVMASGYEPDGDFSIDMSGVLVSFLVGFVIALIVTLVMKSQLKSVMAQRYAASYISKDLMLTQSQDVYLYRTVTKTARPKDKK